MADMQSALRTRLRTAPSVSTISTAFHWVKVPEGASLPYVRLQTISDPRPRDLKGPIGGRETRVQADVFAASYGQARALANAIIAEIEPPARVDDIQFGRTIAEGPQDLGEDVEGQGHIYRASVDLLVWHSLAN